MRTLAPPGRAELPPPPVSRVGPPPSARRAHPLRSRGVPASQRIARWALLALLFLPLILLQGSARPTDTATTQSAWGLPFLPGTIAVLAPGLHDRNWGSILDDTRPDAAYFTLLDASRPDASLDLIPVGARVPVYPLAQGVVLAVSNRCHQVLVDHGSATWVLYAHITASVIRDQAVTRATVLGHTATQVTRESPCGERPASILGVPVGHVHIAFLYGAGAVGAYVSMVDRRLCGHPIMANSSVDGLATPDDWFQVPRC
jgi:hypothetical protein